MTKRIFFRNDDVWKVDQELIKIVNIFIRHKTPILLSVIPGIMTHNCKNYLKKIIEKYPDLIEIGQHGYKHINYSQNVHSKYEFGDLRSYSEQKKNIIEGKKILNKISKEINIFVSPWHGYNKDTIKILIEEGFKIIATDYKNKLSDKKTKIGNIYTNLYYNKRNKKGWYIDSLNKNLKEIYDFPSTDIGLEIHHDKCNEKCFNQLNNLLKNIKKSPIKVSKFPGKGMKKEKNINQEALSYYLNYQFVPKTLTLTKKSINPIKKKYDYSKNIPYQTLNVNESIITKKLYLEIKKAIKSSLPINNEPIGILISGGLDSTIILHVLRELTKRKIYSITGTYNTKSNHIMQAKKIAGKYNCKHKTLLIKPEDLTIIDEIYRKGIPQPIGDNGFLSAYLMLKELKNKVKNVYAGDGADCLFGGLNIHYMNHLKNKYFSEMNPNKLIHSGLNRINIHEYEKYHHYIYGEIFLKQNELNKIIYPNINIQLEKPVNIIKNKIKNEDQITVQRILDVLFFIKNRVEYIEQPAQILEMEMKMPFLSKKLIEFALTIPNKYLIKNLQQKYILKKSFTDQISSKIISKQKEGFTPPFIELYKKNKTYIQKKLVKSTQLGIRKEYITKCLKDLYKPDYQSGMRVWILLNLVTWLENLD